MEELYNRYNEELRPLVSEVEGRLERFEGPLLENLASQFDYVALYKFHGDEKYKAKANEYLSKAISNSYLYIIYALMRDIRKFERRGGLSVMKSQNNTFADAVEFEKLKKSARQAYKKGLKLEDQLSLEYNKEAYIACSKLEKYTTKYSLEFLGKPSTKILNALKFLGSVVISVGVPVGIEYLINLFSK